MSIKKRKVKTNRKAMLEKLEKSIKRVVKKNTSDEESALVVYTTDSGIVKTNFLPLALFQKSATIEGK